MDPQQLVQEFNSLPRTPKTPSGQVDNHWQFAVHHVAFEPSGDLLYMINPGSLYIHSEGPAQITSLATVEEQAELIVPMLLEAFVSCMGMRLQDPRTKAQGPWSWGTEDEKLAKALERRLRAVGVREELCEVKVGDEESIKIEKKNWDILLQKLEEANGPRCSKCNGLQRYVNHGVDIAWHPPSGLTVENMLCFLSLRASLSSKGLSLPGSMNFVANVELGDTEKARSCCAVEAAEWSNTVPRNVKSRIGRSTRSFASLMQLSFGDLLRPISIQRKSWPPKLVSSLARGASSK